MWRKETRNHGIAVTKVAGGGLAIGLLLQNGGQLLLGDPAIAVLVEDPEGRPQHFLLQVLLLASQGYCHIAIDNRCNLENDI